MADKKKDMIKEEILLIVDGILHDLYHLKDGIEKQEMTYRDIRDDLTELYYKITYNYEDISDKVRSL